MDRSSACELIERQLLKLVQDATAGALELPDPQSRLEALRGIHAAIESLRQRLLYTVNEAAPLHRLPRNVLWRILWDVLQEEPRCFMRVCRLWRDGDLLEQPGEFSFQGFPEMAEGMMELVGDSPISLNLNFFQFDEFSSLFSAHAYHIRAFVAKILPAGAPEDGPLTAERLIGALEEPAPLMQVFELHTDSFAWRPDPELTLPDALFSDSAPLLYAVALSGITLRDRPYPALSGVQYLELTQNEINIVRLLRFYPLLEELRTNCSSLVCGRRKVNPHRLRVLQIQSNVQAAEMVVKRLVITRPLSVWMKHARDDLISHVLASVPEGSLQGFRYSVHMSTFLDACCVLEYASGITWVLPSSSQMPRGLLSVPHLVSHLRILTLHELLWPEGTGELPPATQLIRLALILDRRSPQGVEDPSMAHIVSAGVFYDPPYTHCVLPCPALKEVCLTTPSEHPALVVDVCDVSSFLRRTLRLEGSARPALVLRNVLLHDPVLGRGLQSLTLFVSDIKYERSRSPAVSYIHRGSSGSWSSWIYDMMQ